MPLEEDFTNNLKGGWKLLTPAAWDASPVAVALKTLLDQIGLAG